MPAAELAGFHATIRPAAVARESELLLWRAGPARETSAPADDEAELVLPTARGVRRRTVPVIAYRIADVLDDLLGLGAGSGVDRHGGHGAAPTASVMAWSHVAKAAVSLVARGRLQPAVGADGADEWTTSALSRADRDLRQQLVAALPPAAHCLVTAPGPPVRMLAPDRAVAAFTAAVIDSLPRTPAAALVAGQREWAHDDVSDVSRFRSTLVAADHSERMVAGLRVVLPVADDGPFRCELQLRSALDPTAVADASALWAGTVRWLDATAETDLLRAVRRGASVWPPLRRLLDQREPTGMVLEDDEALALFGSVAVDLGAAGLEVLVPSELTRSLRAEAQVEPPPGAGDGPAVFDLRSVCELTWRPTIDGEPVSEDELRALAASHRPVVRVRDEWVVVDPAVVAKLSRRDRVTAADALGAALGGSLVVDDETVVAHVAGPIADLARRLRSAAAPAEVDPPPGLVGELRPYQRRGVGWIEALVELGFGGILADDMGLGKTIQVIAVLLRRRSRPDAGGPTLVVCPASVVTNWERELARFAPGIPVRAHVGIERHLDGLAPGEVVVTTYGLARRDHELLSTIGWGLVVADEAQHVKNPNSSTAKALRMIPSGARVALTGTPVENRLTELWALLDWATPGLLGSVETFRRRVSIPIERDRDDEVTARFARLISPFLLRRRKDDPQIAPELPPKTETVHPVVLTPEQAGLYRATSDRILDEIAAADGITRRGLVLKLLTALKQICNHPAHFLGESGPLVGRSGKLDAFDELVGAIADAGDSTLVFTQYVTMGRLLMTRLAELGLGAEMLDGSVPLRKRAVMVDRFQEGEFPVFVISLKAGGTGLNLTRATHVVHYDRWWNPAVENQASDRAWRIGQDRPVQVHQLISDGTLEERIAEALAAKQALADAVVGDGEAWLTELGDEELAELVGLGRVD